ncbi:glycosyltransferase [Loigolactobacillus bifermentans]|nr:glycosyltransferase [Loigolactobacillus bifermentans]
MSSANDKPLVTVIVPAYNSAEYLFKNVTSIIQQTYKNIEIIIIDDGSTDSSDAVYDKLSKSDSRVRVIFTT